MYSSHVTSEANQAKINGKNVLQGEGHLQPSVNPWIGIFLVEKDLIEGTPDQWVSTVISYEGPFNCRGKYTTGKGRAKITHVRPDNEGRSFFISVEGTEAPQLDNEPKPLKFSYNENLGL